MQPHTLGLQVSKQDLLGDLTAFHCFADQTALFCGKIAAGVQQSQSGGWRFSNSINTSHARVSACCCKITILMLGERIKLTEACSNLPPQPSTGGDMEYLSVRTMYVWPSIICIDSNNSRLNGTTLILAHTVHKADISYS